MVKTKKIEHQKPIVKVVEATSKPLSAVLFLTNDKSDDDVAAFINTLKHKNHD